MTPVLITTQHRGVFVAYAESKEGLHEKTLKNLKKVRMVINWRNSQGVQGIAQNGPENCKLSATTDAMVLHDVTAVFEITPQAEKEIWAA